jgi:hypothetical protein
MFAIPTPGRSVPIPGSRSLLPATGQNIGQVTQYWQRRLRDGDITLSETQPVTAATPAKEAAVPTPAPAASAPTAAANAAANSTATATAEPVAGASRSST